MAINRFSLREATPTNPLINTNLTDKPIPVNPSVYPGMGTNLFGSEC
jgi:hypothetical protein